MNRKLNLGAGKFIRIIIVNDDDDHQHHKKWSEFCTNETITRVRSVISSHVTETKLYCRI